MPAEAFEVRLDGVDDDDEGMFEMSVTEENSGGHGPSCVVNGWLSHGHDDDVCSGADDLDGQAGNRCLLAQPISKWHVTESPVKQEILSTVPYCQTVPTCLDFTSVIVELVQQYATQVRHFSVDSKSMKCVSK